MCIIEINHRRYKLLGRTSDRHVLGEGFFVLEDEDTKSTIYIMIEEYMYLEDQIESRAKKAS